MHTRMHTRKHTAREATAAENKSHQVIKMMQTSPTSQSDAHKIGINTLIVQGRVIVLIKLDLGCCSLKVKPDRNNKETLLRLCIFLRVKSRAFK